MSGHPSYFAAGLPVHNCQALSRARFAQEAILKILEDGPDHVHFFLATTDPKKLLATVVNRCAKITTHAVKEADLAELVRRVAKAEKLVLDDATVNSIVESANGSPRAALVQLEAVAKLAPDERRGAIERVGVEKVAFDLVRELMPFKGSPSWPTVAKILTDCKEEDPEGIRRMVLASARSSILKGGELGKQAFRVIRAFRDPYFDASAHALLACDAYEVVFGGK